MRRGIATGIVVALALWLTACAGESDTPGERSLLGSPSPGEEAEAKKTKRGDKKQGGRKKAGGRQVGAVEAAPGEVGTAPEQVDVPGADEEKQYPTGSSEVDEPQPDAKTEGVTPGYAEVLNISVEGQGKQLRVTFTMNGDVPERMPTEETIMVIGFQVLRGSEEGYVLAAQATNKGWKPYAGGKEEDEAPKFPGSFSIEGNSIVLTAPWSYFKGAYPFKWIATSNWFQSLANTTHYLFDLVPNKGQANYPA
jgi:hypothetical protein